jgi:hypothetical protein
MSALSRRSLVASAAALPALVVPAVAESHLDGLLIELGRKFDRTSRCRIWLGLLLSPGQSGPGLS